jgi:hypothetical protein
VSDDSQLRHWPRAVRAGLALFALLFGSANVAAQNMVVNGGFENGLSAWTIWNGPPQPPNFPWTRDSSCYLFPTTPGCAFTGQGAYRHFSVGPYVIPGGIYQVVDVLPGRTYRVQWWWYGYTSGIGPTNHMLWAMRAFDGSVDPSQADSNTAHDLAEISVNSGPPFFWMRSWTLDAGEFQTGPSTTQVTLVLEHRSTFNFSSTLSLDDVSMVLQGEPVVPVPIISTPAMLLLAAVLMGIGVSVLVQVRTRSS